ncbi:hypothetical protein [Granulosicoccus antarcticus]|uniref:Uncharacterized protein n=1 Tax=Granulosicoccus antarcticus IMCC3135 TaxID=1192854 RepID=A0A2Z2NXA3_9GAMM|nr:hypothetical protein [Granulosicoccus antarcticus]ASJ76082.1 hypothetical protein IMCC3135_30165 [Granulosicoccus antarcticus IMCC3135]
MTSPQRSFEIARDPAQASHRLFSPVCAKLQEPEQGLFGSGMAALPEQPRSGAKLFAVLLASCLLAACGGSSNSTSTPTVDAEMGTGTETEDDDELGQNETPDTGVVGQVGDPSVPSVSVPDELTDIDRVALSIGDSARCSAVGESFDVNITRGLTEEELAAGVLSEPQDVSAYVTLTQDFGDSLELLSRGDGAVQFRHQEQNMVSLTAELENGSVTTYLAGISADAPASVVLRKPVVGGCLYALRLPDYCATGLAKGGTLSFNRDGDGISAVGCELSNPNGYPVIELPAPKA